MFSWNHTLILKRFHTYVFYPLQYLDSNNDNMINFKEFVWLLGVLCRSSPTERLRLIYLLHLPPALLPSDPLDDTPGSPQSGMVIVLCFSLMMVLVVVVLSLHTRIWVMVLTNQSLPAFFFLKWRSSHAHQLHSLIQSMVAQQAEMMANDCSLTNCLWAYFPGGFPHYALTACVWVFRCNLPFALLVEWPGHFTCHCGKMGVEETRKKS